MEQALPLGNSAAHCTTSLLFKPSTRQWGDPNEGRGWGHFLEKSPCTWKVPNPWDNPPFCVCVACPSTTAILYAQTCAGIARETMAATFQDAIHCICFNRDIIGCLV